MGNYSLYLLLTKRGTIYTGITLEVERRIAEHRGEWRGGARYTRAVGVVALLYSCEIGSRSLASKVEWAVKRISRSRKEWIATTNISREELLRYLDIPMTP